VNPQRLLYWAPRLFAGIGVLLLAVAAVTAFLTFRFVAGSDRADGTVVDLVESYDSEDDTTSYYPVVRFETADGRAVRFESGVSTSDDVGDGVEVLYDPDDPDDAKLAGFFNLWGLSLIFGGLGAVFTRAASRAPEDGRFRPTRSLDCRVRSDPADDANRAAESKLQEDREVQKWRPPSRRTRP
jgi:hypothetical protein